MLLVLFILIICLWTGSAKYNETPSFVLKVFDNTTSFNRIRAALSPDDSQLMICILNQNNTDTTSQSIFYFNSTKICSITIEQTNFDFLAWPLATKGFIIDYQQGQTFKKQSDFCSQPVNLISLEKDYQSFAFRNTAQTSYITVLMDKNRILEYDMSSGQLNRNMTLNGSELLQIISYSRDQRYLFTEGNQKVIIYNASSLQRLSEINSLPYMILVNGMNDGKSFFASNFMDRSFSFFHIEKTGSKVIHAGKFEEQFVGMCTVQSVIVVLQKGIDGGYDLITYNSTDGGSIQNITLPLKGVVQTSVCNNDYLAIIDDSGTAYIYKYVIPQPQPKPDPQPDTDNNDNFSLIMWTVSIIAIIQTIVIVVLSTVIYGKRKVNNKNNKELKDKLINSETQSQIED